MIVKLQVGGIELSSVHLTFVGLPGAKSTRTRALFGGRVGSPFMQATSVGSHQSRTSVLFNASFLLKLGLHTAHRPTQFSSVHGGGGGGGGRSAGPDPGPVSAPVLQSHSE